MHTPTRSHQKLKQLGPRAELHQVVRPAIGLHVAIEGDRTQAIKPVWKCGPQAKQLGVECLKRHAISAAIQLGESHVPLAMDLGLARSAQHALAYRQECKGSTYPSCSRHVLREAGSNGGTASSQTHEPQQAIQPIVDPLIEPVRNAAVLDIEERLVLRALVGAGFAGSRHQYLGLVGSGGGGFRIGGVCALPGESEISMGGPSKSVDGVRASMLAEQDRPPTPARTRNSLWIRAKVAHEDGTRRVLDMVCGSRRDADEIIDRMYPEHRSASLIVHHSQRITAC
ncbi:MAG: hypothetical protein EOP38_20465 [Rubrivivax sp.]|nr:MAG: hypothetical protein EOP38_20465 [Rubrivivax sp.]